MRVKERVRLELVRAGVRPKELAEKFGFTEQFAGRMLSEGAGITVDRMNGLAEILNCEVSDLYPPSNKQSAQSVADESLPVYDVTSTTPEVGGQTATEGHVESGASSRRSSRRGQEYPTGAALRPPQAHSLEAVARFLDEISRRSIALAHEIRGQVAAARDSQSRSS